jgi:hypothetical protein
VTVPPSLHRRVGRIVFAELPGTLAPDWISLCRVVSKSNGEPVYPFRPSRQLTATSAPAVPPLNRVLFYSILGIGDPANICLWLGEF